MPIDMRTRKLAKIAVRYSLDVKSGDRVIISGSEESIPFMVELYKEVILQKAHPIIRFALPNVSDFFYKYATKEQIERFPEETMDILKRANKSIRIDTELNTRELTNCNSKKMTARAKVLKPISDYIDKGKEVISWLVVAYPCLALAQESEMSLNEYENFVYGACLQDWKKLKNNLEKIAKTFEKGRRVHLIGENVDLKFSIEGKNALADCGECNMPGGEVYMAPVRKSLEGEIKFEYASIRDGKEITNIFLRFEKGKVVESRASKNEDFLREMLNTDENASYVGEFGIGCNSKIKKYTNNLLFDEKIGGTIHLALGSAYKDNGGGNDSAIHWDIVKDMHKAKIILDGNVVQENGIWKIKGVKF